MDQRGLIADPGSALPPMLFVNMDLGPYCRTLQTNASSSTHTHKHTMHIVCAPGIHKTDIPFVVLKVFKCILIYLVSFLPKEIHCAINQQLLLPP